MTLFGDLLRAAERLPEKVALVGGAERVRYATLAERAQRLAQALRRRGVEAGDRVLIFVDNSVEAVVSFWGTWAARAVAVPVHPSTKADKLAWLIEHCGAGALISRRKLAAELVPALRATRGPRALLVVDGAAEIDGATDFDAALAAEAGASDALNVGASEEDLAAILYTSGSTGRPKGVMLTHANMRSAAAAIATYLGLREDDVVQGLSPLSFDYGLYQSILSVHEGARLVLAPPFTLPAQVLKQTASEQVTFFPGVPTQFALLAALRDLSSWDLSSVRAVTSTAATLTPRHVETIQRIFPRARIFSMYGLTECKRCSYLPPEELTRKPGSVGIAIPGTELWLVDEAGQRLGPNQIGQLVVRGRHVMRGYWNDPEATAAALRPGPAVGERVLYTGDLCRLDDDGYLYFVARMDDIIKSRGEKVAPKEVELALQAVAGVREAAVIGVPDDVQGEAVHAFVVTDPGAGLDAGALLRECRSRLESYLVPTRIELLPALPKSANGKIDRRALATLARCGSVAGG